MSLLLPSSFCTLKPFDTRAVGCRPTALDCAVHAGRFSKTARNRTLRKRCPVFIPPWTTGGKEGRQRTRWNHIEMMKGAARRVQLCNTQIENPSTPHIMKRLLGCTVRTYTGSSTLASPSRQPPRCATEESSPHDIQDSLFARSSAELTAARVRRRLAVKLSCHLSCNRAETAETRSMCDECSVNQSHQTSARNHGLISWRPNLRNHKVRTGTNWAPTQPSLRRPWIILGTEKGRLTSGTERKLVPPQRGLSRCRIARGHSTQHKRGRHSCVFAAKPRRWCN